MSADPAVASTPHATGRGGGADDSSRRGDSCGERSFPCPRCWSSSPSGGRGGLERGRRTPTASLDLYTGVVNSETLGRLVRQGYDIADARPAAGGVQVDLVLTEAEVAKLRQAGRRPCTRGATHRAARRRSAPPSRRPAASTSGARRTQPGGIRDELYDDRPEATRSIVKLEVLGHTLQGREIIALKVTQRRTTARRRHAAGGPLHVDDQHAREWISTEVNRRLLHYFVDNYGENADVTNLLNTTELWFVVGRQPGRLPVHVRPRAAVAQEPARQQRRRADHRRRRRRPEPQLRRALGLRQRGLVDADLRATTTAAPAPRRSPRRRRSRG